MKKEYTVDERAEIAKKAMPALLLSNKLRREVDEVLYTLSEAGDLPRIDFEHVALVWAAVEMVKAGGFTSEMRL